MRRPSLVTPSSVLPVSIQEVKLSLRIDGDDLDTEIESQIKAALAHYQGWDGILGISILRQKWRQDYDSFSSQLCIPIGPFSEGDTTLTVFGSEGQQQDIDPSAFRVTTNSANQTTLWVDFGNVALAGVSWASSSSIEYFAGYATVPEDIKSAMKLRVQMMIDEAASANSQHLERAERALIGKYRRISV